MPTLSYPNELNIETFNVRKAVLAYRAINNNLRQMILHLLHQNSSMTVTDIYTKLRWDQSVASQHLAVLRKNNIVTSKREGKCIYYSVNYEKLRQFQEISKQLKEVPGV